MASEIERTIYGEWADRVTPSGEMCDQCLLEFAISPTQDSIRMSFDCV